MADEHGEISSEVDNSPPPELVELLDEITEDLVEPVNESLEVELSDVEMPDVDEGEEAPLPLRGSDISLTISLPFDISTYGGRHYFEYTRAGEVRSSSWVLPEATTNGQEFRFVGHGEEGSFGGESGDLIISVQVEESERAPDIFHEISIPWENSKYQHLGKLTLNRGGEDEEIQFTIPADIQSGQYIRVRGAGNPEIEGLPSGDLIIKVLVTEPLPPEDIHAYAVVNFWVGVKLFFGLTPKVKIYKISNNNYIKSFNKLKKKHRPEISWTFPGEGETGKGIHPNSDLYLTPHYTGKAYLAPAISSLVILLLLSLSILGQQALTWTGENAFYARYLSEPAQSGPSSSTRNENITFDTTKPTWAPDGFQLLDSDPNIAVRMPDPSTYDCTSAKTLNCLNVEVYSKVKCEVLKASVVFYSEDLKVNESAELSLRNFKDLNITTINFYPQSKKPFPKWDFLTINCTQVKK